MKEIKITANLKQLKEKQKQQIPWIQGGYYIEFYFSSSRVCSKPFIVDNEKSEIKINQTLNVMNTSGDVIEIWLKTYNEDQFIASGQIAFSDIKEDQEGQIRLIVESQVLAILTADIQVIINNIEKEIIQELDEDCLKKVEIDVEAEERKRLEEERKKREQEELEALKKALAKKVTVTVTNQKKLEEPYF